MALIGWSLHENAHKTDSIYTMYTVQH